MKYPLQLRFKTLSLTNEIRLIDNEGQELAYIRQKLFKLKEEIVVYKDHTKKNHLYTIKADKAIDWSPTYTTYDKEGKPVSSSKRDGAKSLWNAKYDVTIAGKPFGTLREQNPWVKLLDGVFEMVPFLGFIMGYVFNPVYELRDPSKELIATLSKRPALLEGRYEIEAGSLASMPEDTQKQVVMSLMTIAILERTRG